MTRALTRLSNVLIFGRFALQALPEDQVDALDSSRVRASRSANRRAVRINPIKKRFYASAEIRKSVSKLIR
jgi:hypothetical protein